MLFYSAWSWLNGRITVNKAWRASAQVFTANSACDKCLFLLYIMSTTKLLSFFTYFNLLEQVHGIGFFPNSISTLCNNSPRSYLFSALGATLWRWGPSVCGGGWSIRTESGRSAGSCSAPSASSPGPTRRRTTCRCVAERFPLKPTDPEPLSLVAPSTKLKLCC